MKKLSKYKICGEINTTITGKLLYLVLDDLANRDGEVTIAQRKISGALGISQSTVSNNLCRLRDNGFISIRSQFNSDGGRSVNKYIVR